jgi:hypothetical protein
MPLNIALVALVASACGPSMVQQAPPPPPLAPKEKPAEPDVFRDHRGKHVAAGETFRLTHKPVAVDGPNVIVSLVKTEWTTIQTPGGKEVKEATAVLTVEQGQDQRQVSVGQGEARTAFNARVTVIGAGEDYDPARLVYQAWVDLKVELAP